MEAEVENYPVSDLPSRYNLGKQAIYNRLDSLGIRPSKVGKRSYISTEQLQALDRLHAHILEGGSMADLNSPVDLSTASTGQIKTSPLDSIDKSTGLELINLIAGAVSQSIASTVQQRSPLWYLRELEAARTEGWLLTTGEVQELIGVKPKITKGKSTYERGTYAFVKAGKIGSQAAWQVKKIRNYQKFPDEI